MSTGTWIRGAALMALLGMHAGVLAQAPAEPPASPEEERESAVESAQGESLQAESLQADAQLQAPPPESTEEGPSSAPADEDRSAEAMPNSAPAASVPDPALPCAGRAREVALDAVVRVRSGDRWGAGFVYSSPRHVVTSFGLLALGRDVTVVTRDGTHLPAQVLARDEALDLVVLETAEPVPGATPLRPAPETSAMVGRPVVALGHPFGQFAGLLGERGEGLLRWSIATGTVAAANDVGIQADVALTEGHEGGPLLDCEGRVLGVVAGGPLRTPDLGLAARIGHVDTLIEGAGPAGDFLGNFRLHWGIGGALLIDQDGEVAGGGYLTLGATLFDRISWMNRVGLFMGGAEEPAEDVLSLERRQVRIESMLGWRFFFDIGGFTSLYIVPSAGLTVTHEDIDTRSARVVPDCVPSDGASCIAITETSVDGWHVRPAIGLTFIFGGRLEVGYTLEIEVEEPVTTFHTLVLGLLF